MTCTLSKHPNNIPINYENKITGTQGLLDAGGRKGINLATYYLFMPSLMFYALVRSVTITKLISWWSLLANMIMSVILGMAGGWLTAPLVGTPVHLRTHFMCCAGLGATSSAKRYSKLN